MKRGSRVEGEGEGRRGMAGSDIKRCITRISYTGWRGEGNKRGRPKRIERGWKHEQGEEGKGSYRELQETSLPFVLL